MLALYGETPWPYQNYIVVSIGYKVKDEAYDCIRNDFKGEDVTTYYCQKDDKWYVIKKN